MTVVLRESGGARHCLRIKGNVYNWFTQGRGAWNGAGPSVSKFPFWDYRNHGFDDVRNHP